MAGNDVEIRVRVRDFASPGLRRIDDQAKAMRGSLGGTAAGLVRIGAAAAGLVYLGPAAAAMQQLAGAALLLPGALSVGAAIVGTLATALSGVNEALTATSTKSASTGASVAAMARQIRDANRGIADARRGVEEANRRVADAERSVQDATRGVEDAQRTADDAARTYAQALADEERATRAVADAAKDAERNLADLAEQQSDAARDVRGASLALRRAEDDLRKTQRDSKATVLDKQEASYRLAVAQDRLSDAQRDAADTTAKLDDATKKGIQGSDAVVAAQDAATAAHERTLDAARQVADANRGIEQAQRGVADAARGLEDAHRGVADAEQGVADAVERLNDVYAQQAEQAANAAGGVDAYAAALAKLSPNARELVTTLKSLAPAWDAVQRSVQDRFFAGMAADVVLLAQTYLPVLRVGLGGIADQLNSMASYTADALLDPGTVDAVNVVLANTAQFLGDASTSLGDFLAGFLELAAIGSEYLPDLGVWIGDIASNFREWVETNPDGIRTLIDDALRGFGDLWGIITDVGAVLGAIFSGLGQGTGPKDFLEGVHGMTSSLVDFAESPGVQSALAIIGGIAQMIIDTLPIWGPVAAGIGVMSVAMGILNAVMAANPIGLIIVGIGLLVSAFMYAWNNVDGFREFWINAWNGIKAGFNIVIDAIVGGFNWMVDTARWVGRTVSGALAGAWDGLVAGAKWAANGAISILNGLIYAANQLIWGLNVVNPFTDIPYIPYVPYLAKGGVAGGMAVVGEQGPELVNLPQGSTVIPAGQSRRMMGDMATAQGGAGGPTRVELVSAGGGDEVAAMLNALIRKGKLQLKTVA